MERRLVDESSGIEVHDTPVPPAVASAAAVRCGVTGLKGASAGAISGTGATSVRGAWCARPPIASTKGARAKRAFKVRAPRTFLWATARIGVGGSRPRISGAKRPSSGPSREGQAKASAQVLGATRTPRGLSQSSGAAVIASGGAGSGRRSPTGLIARRATLGTARAALEGLAPLRSACVRRPTGRAITSA